MSEQGKDPLVNFKNTKIQQKQDGSTYTSLSLSREQAQDLINAMSQVVTERGVKLDIHTKKRTSQQGRTFDSSFTFVKGIQEPRNSAGVSGGSTFVPKKSGNSPAASAAAGNLLNTTSIK